MTDSRLQQELAAAIAQQLEQATTGRLSVATQTTDFNGVFRVQAAISAEEVVYSLLPTPPFTMRGDATGITVPHDATLHLRVDLWLVLGKIQMQVGTISATFETNFTTQEATVNLAFTYTPSGVTLLYDGPIAGWHNSATVPGARQELTKVSAAAAV